MMLAAIVLSALSMTTASAAPSPFTIERLGTADFSMVETTPVVWKGKLLRFESVRGGYGGEPHCPTCGLERPDPAMKGSSYYRFRDVASPLSVTASFAPGYSFGCAFVQPASSRSDAQGDTMWAFGRGSNSTQIGAWWSTDLETWHQGLGLQLTGFGHTAKDYTVSLLSSVFSLSFCALCALRSALCAPLSALCALRSALCSLRSALYARSGSCTCSSRARRLR